MDCEGKGPRLTPAAAFVAGLDLWQGYANPSPHR
jgi:hypothetical protein